MMDTVQTWLTAHAGWAPLVVFAITFIESLPGLSLLVPATALLVMTGALLGSGALDPWPVLGGAIAGAILGDAVGFWLSRAFGPRAVRRFLPRSQRRNYARGLLLFRRWGWSAVFFGRFLGPMRAVAPLLAGVARMRERHFQTANIASAIVWAPAMLFPGYAAARGMEQIAASDHPMLLGGIILVLGGAVWWGVRRWRARRLPLRDEA